MAAITSVLEDPQVKTILDVDRAIIAELEERVTSLKTSEKRAHVKATNRRNAIRGLERRCEHLEHLLAAERGTSERVNKVDMAVRMLLRACGNDPFTAFDAIVMNGLRGRIDELCEYIAELPTNTCENGCGEWMGEAVRYSNDGKPFCPTCWNSRVEEGG